MPAWYGAPASCPPRSFIRKGTPAKRPGQLGVRRHSRGALEGRKNDGVELRVELLDPRNRGFDQLERRNIATAQELCLRRGVESGEVRRQGSPPQSVTAIDRNGCARSDRDGRVVGRHLGPATQRQNHPRRVHLTVADCIGDVAVFGAGRRTSTAPGSRPESRPRCGSSSRLGRRVRTERARPEPRRTRPEPAATHLLRG